VEELIDGKIVLSMRAIYQSKIGLGLMDKGIVWNLNISYLFLISKSKFIKKYKGATQVRIKYTRDRKRKKLKKKWKLEILKSKADVRW
jgi:hypothetical protein